MTSATTRPAGDAGGGYAEGRGSDVIVFAAVVLAVLGSFDLSYGSAAIAKAHYVFCSLSSWGLVTIILGALQLLAAIGVTAGNQPARWFGVAVVGLHALHQLFFIPAYPFWCLTIIAGDIIAIWGLRAYGSRENLGAETLQRTE